MQEHSEFEDRLVPDVLTIVLSFFTTAKARTLRLACSSLLYAVTAQPWEDEATGIVDGPRWAACFPRARTAKARGRVAARSLIAALAGVPQLKTLDLAHCGIGADGGVAALAAALPAVPLLTTLYLGGNAIGAGGVAALAAALSALPLLTTLDLCSNAIGADGAVALAAALPAVPLLTTLDLSGNAIGAEGEAALEEAQKCRLVRRT